MNNDLDVLYEEAQSLLKDKNYNEAINILQVLVESEYEPAYKMLISVYKILGQDSLADNIRKKINEVSSSKEEKGTLSVETDIDKKNIKGSIATRNKWKDTNKSGIIKQKKDKNNILDLLDYFINITTVILIFLLLVYSIVDSISVNEIASLYSEEELYSIFAIQSQFIAFILWLIISALILGGYFLWSKAIVYTMKNIESQKQKVYQKVQD